MKSELMSQIDHYYFNELMSGMHPMLQSIATDKRLMHMATEPERIDSLTALFSESYILLPWQCADILEASEKDLLTISQAYIPILVAYLILDEMVDGQLPESLQRAALVYSHFLLAAKSKFAQCFPPTSLFWGSFDEYMSELFNGLAAESASAKPQAKNHLRRPDSRADRRTRTNSDASAQHARCRRGPRDPRLLVRRGHTLAVAGLYTDESTWPSFSFLVLR